MAKKKVVPVIPEQPPVDNEHVAKGSTPFAEEEPKAKKEQKTSFDVYNAGGAFIRTYSVEQHGKDAEKLAEEYAKKLSGSVK